MVTHNKSASALILGLIVSVMLFAQACASDNSNPSIAAGVPFFYYNDLNAAANWYENKIGLKKVTEEEWVVIFELTDTSYM